MRTTLDADVCFRVEDADGHRIEGHLTGSGRVLTLTVDDPECAHVLLRCAQEAITNAVRHAGAGRLWLDARRDGDNIVLQVRDDGRGSDQVTPGNGLRGLGERLRQRGAYGKIDPGRGGVT